MSDSIDLHQFSVTDYKSPTLRRKNTTPLYRIFFLEESATFSVDFVKYTTPKHSVLFLSPYQYASLEKYTPEKVKVLQFHGDFYCIEYHKKEVACNGLLFNNIYLQPYVEVADVFDEITAIITKITGELIHPKPFSTSVLKTYLQLILALCSREKKAVLDTENHIATVEDELSDFQNLIQIHFKNERSPSFYADTLAISSSSLSKRTKQLFAKTPTQLIQERVVLEAKKLLHLTHKSIKEIAGELCFEDEFYFSRYFKKHVGLSPLHFREKVGISIVAK